MKHSGHTIFEEAVLYSLLLVIEEHPFVLTATLLIGVSLALLLLPWGLRFLGTILEKRTQQDWGDTLDSYLPLTHFIHAFVRLGQLTVIVGGAIGLLHLWGYESPVWYTVGILTTMWPTLSRILGSGAVLIIAYVSGLAISSWMDSLSSNTSSIDRHDREIIKRVIQITILITAVLFILTLWNFDVSGLLLVLV
ncbi:hypothetical protein [Natronococcus jeotgali]|uniref:Small-conductance mechanosensitive channel n=1 Tax=Natronococcus jeotgali DSM 18795 TaxID=1227498 RepID=L9XN31_9EURY|nr:hypothetical protein [Natronococcus jeotgali]ELY63204.1 small-conductance mechanosensitive channel [Natronococcus jeotgali DSM 18795]